MRRHEGKVTGRAATRERDGTAAWPAALSLGYRPDMPGIVIVELGFRRHRDGDRAETRGFHDFVILDKGDDLGGTWRDNQYPGCACDVPSPLYSYSFELNPAWSRIFAPRQEIWDYLRMCTRKHGLDEHIRYGCAVERMDWDDEARRWNIETVESGRWSATGRGPWYPPGARCPPARLPGHSGRQRFGGTSFHSARWDPSADLAGKRVAVIGTGASAIQFVPEIAKQAARLTVFQRTPPWIHPRPDVEIPARLRATFSAVPLTARACRDAIYLLMEARAVGFAVNQKLMAPLDRQAAVVERGRPHAIDVRGGQSRVDLLPRKRRTLGEAWYILQAIFSPTAGTSRTRRAGIVARRMLLLVAGLAAAEWIRRRQPHVLTVGRFPRPIRWTVYSALVWAVILCSTSRARSSTSSFKDGKKEPQRHRGTEKKKREKKREKAGVACSLSFSSLFSVFVFSVSLCLCGSTSSSVAL